MTSSDPCLQTLNQRFSCLVWITHGFSCLLLSPVVSTSSIRRPSHQVTQLHPVVSCCLRPSVERLQVRSVVCCLLLPLTWHSNSTTEQLPHRHHQGNAR